MCFYNSNYCNNSGQYNCVNNKNCCQEQTNNFGYCGMANGNSYCYYPTVWQSENTVEEQQNNNYERADCMCNSKHFYCREQGQNSQQNCESNNCFRYNCLKQKQCNKTKKRCCFCDLFNCICGRW